LKVREEKALAEAEAAKEKARADAAANASEEKRLALEAETREANRHEIILRLSEAAYRGAGVHQAMSHPCRGLGLASSPTLTTRARTI
jgi:hypothetical protein